MARCQSRPDIMTPQPSDLDPVVGQYDADVGWATWANDSGKNATNNGPRCVPEKVLSSQQTLETPRQSPHQSRTSLSPLKSSVAASGSMTQAGDVLPSPERGRSCSLSPGLTPSGSLLSLQIHESSPRTTFTTELASATEHAHLTLAASFVGHLQQRCVTEASSGRCVAEWEAKLPGNKTFVGHVAREFAHRVHEMDFVSVEWWGGKDWLARPGKFSVWVDHAAQTYHMRLRVRWLDRLPPGVEPALPRDDDQSQLSNLAAVLSLQRDMLSRAIHNQACALARIELRTSDQIVL